MAGRSLCLTSDLLRWWFTAHAPPNPPTLPEEIRLDLWPSFTSPRIKPAVCSNSPRPHESNFIDHLESYRHPLNTKCRWKASGWKEMSTSCRDWRWDHHYYTQGCDENVAAAAHKYGDFTSNKILYNRRGLKHTLIFNKYRNMFVIDTESILLLLFMIFSEFWLETFLMDLMNVFGPHMDN